MDEYGNPENAGDWSFISQYSPYQKVVQDQRYPRVLFMATTGIVASRSYAQKSSETLESIIKALLDGLAFVLSPANKSQVIKTLMNRFKSSDALLVEQEYADAIKDLEPKPYPSVEGVRNMERRRDETKKVLRASLRGIRYTLDPANRAKIVSLLSQWLELDQETAEYTYDIFKKVAAPDGTLTRSQMETLLNERKRQGKVTADIALDKIYNFSMVQEINRELAQGK